MKHTLILLLLISFLPMVTLAQKHSVYADVGLPAGVSATYNYNLAKHFNVGVGTQGYMTTTPGNDNLKFVPAIFADIRLLIMPTKKNQLFAFWDFGINFYRQEKNYLRDATSVYYYPHNNGFCFGMGFGYFRPMTKRDGGLYLSLKLYGNLSTVYGYSIVAPEDDTGLITGGADPAICLGFKF